jgi:hypothetical protein
LERKDSRHDRVAFASRVQALLRQDKFDEAKRIVGAADTLKFDTIAAWNLMLEFAMEQKKSPDDAWKLYNDVSYYGLIGH